MPYQRPNYPSPNTRLDQIAQQVEGVNFDDALWSVINANRDWDGSMYLDDAVIPTGDEILTQSENNLRPRAAELTAMLDAPRTDLPANTGGIRGQTKSDLSGIASVQEAAWWSAQMRVLLIAGSLWGNPENGTNLVLDIFSQLITEENLADYESTVDAALNLDSDWYSADVTAYSIRAAMLTILANMSIHPSAEV